MSTRGGRGASRGAPGRGASQLVSRGGRVRGRGRGKWGSKYSSIWPSEEEREEWIESGVKRENGFVVIDFSKKYPLPSKNELQYIRNPRNQLLPDDGESDDASQCS